jgi:predicted phosphodiesterase
MKRLALLVLCLACAGPVSARDAEGRLALIRAPHNGMPVILTAGQSFEAVLEEEAALSLVGAQATHPLEAKWSALPGQLHRAHCTVPALAPGAYALQAATASRTDSNVRAVFIREDFPEYYVLAHVSDTHVGSERNIPSYPETNQAVFAAVSASEAALCLVTGDVTDGGEVAQFQQFLQVLDTCTLPTFVVPGNHDRQALNYEAYFTPHAYSFTFGHDGYLGFDSKDFITADSLGPQDGLLQRLRRELKPSRWTIGFSHRYESNQGMRSQLALFVDDPLDFLVFGHWHRENSAEQQVVPWGTTRITVVPAAIDGAYRLIDVTQGKGLVPRPFARAVETVRRPRD